MPFCPPSDDIRLRLDHSWPWVENVSSGTKPLVLHGNGPSKGLLNAFGNYVPRTWNGQDQCLACLEGMLDDKEALTSGVLVVLAIFVEQPTPFIEEFFQKVSRLNFPQKSLIHLHLHNVVPSHRGDVETFLEDHVAVYKSVRVVEPQVSEADARELGLLHCRSLQCHYYFSLDSIAHLENPDTLKLLMQQNRKILAPMLSRPFQVWSNFWGDLNEKGGLFVRVDCKISLGG